MSERTFQVRLSQTAARRAHARRFAEVLDTMPWEALEPADFPPQLIARARIGWTENAFNEYCTAIGLTQLLQALMCARAPLDLWTFVAPLVDEELLHVELCSRLAMRLGGGAPIRYQEEDLQVALDPSLSALQRANQLAVQICCVGEALSFPLLSGCMRSATNPLTKAVLTKIVADEASHGKFGYFYLDWIGPDLKPAERDRLGRIAERTIEHYSPIWEKLHSRVKNGVTSEGYRIEDIRALGWMESSEYKALARKSVADNVVAPLGKYGIKVRA